ncbi:hypothetical protein GCM10022419_116090 [Nonomuraea rosea]|uniref:Uncharacterized protein n=1 Tax=Nonomuraea rosea TaxID=638574 RepID=A0ABP6ZJM4_9ACTN
MSRPSRRRGRPRACPDDVLLQAVTLRKKGVRLIDICNFFNAENIPMPGGRPSRHLRLGNTVVAPAAPHPAS